MPHVPNQYRNEPYGTPLYASFLVALQEFLGSAALNFHLSGRLCDRRAGRCG